MFQFTIQNLAETKLHGADSGLAGAAVAELVSDGSDTALLSPHGAGGLASRQPAHGGHLGGDGGGVSGEHAQPTVLLAELPECEVREGIHTGEERFLSRQKIDVVTLKYMNIYNNHIYKYMIILYVIKH